MRPSAFSGRASYAAHAPRLPPARDEGRSCALPPPRGCVRTKPVVHSSRNDEVPLAGRRSLVPPAPLSYARLSTSSLADRSTPSLCLSSLLFSRSALPPSRSRSTGGSSISEIPSRRKRAVLYRLPSAVAVYRFDTRASSSISGRVLKEMF